MLTSEKCAELVLDIENATFNSQCVHMGDEEFDAKRRNAIEERRRLLSELGMVARPVSGTELRRGLSIECLIALRENYEPEFLVGNENQAYTRTKRTPNSSPRLILFREKHTHWLPKQYQEKARALLKLCPRGIVVPLAVFLYGGLESGFAYGARRNEEVSTSVLFFFILFNVFFL